MKNIDERIIELEKRVNELEMDKINADNMQESIFDLAGEIVEISKNLNLLNIRINFLYELLENLAKKKDIKEEKLEEINFYS